MKYNVIGDIHGRPIWKKLVQDDAVNIFVGDYFDPYMYENDYKGYSFKECVANFKELMKYADSHQCVFLLGNHDAPHYIWRSEMTCRYFYGKENETIHNLFKKYAKRFQLAYSIGNKYLVTHAGVTRPWYEYWVENKEVYGLRRKDYKGERNTIIDPDHVAEEVNKLFTETSDGYMFLFRPNRCYFSDEYGMSQTHGPMWVRDETLNEHSLFKGTDYIQIFGHTQHYGLVKSGVGEFEPVFGIHGSRWVNVDCLGSEKPETYRIEL